MSPLAEVARLLSEAAWFREENRLMPGGQIFATHFSPHHCPPHQETHDYLREHGVTVIDLASAECVKLLADYIAANPAIWNEDIGEE